MIKQQRKSRISFITMAQSNVQYEKSQSLRDSIIPGPLLASILNITADK